VTTNRYRCGCGNCSSCSAWRSVCRSWLSNCYSSSPRPAPPRPAPAPPPPRSPWRPRRSSTAPLAPDPRLLAQPSTLGPTLAGRRSRKHKHLLLGCTLSQAPPAGLHTVVPFCFRSVSVLFPFCFRSISVLVPARAKQNHCVSATTNSCPSPCPPTTNSPPCRPPQGNNHYVSIEFDQPVAISAIRVWNYNKVRR
jgi:hypothetical protein